MTQARRNIVKESVTFPIPKATAWAAWINICLSLPPWNLSFFLGSLSLWIWGLRSSREAYDNFIKCVRPRHVSLPLCLSLSLCLVSSGILPLKKNVENVSKMMIDNPTMNLAQWLTKAAAKRFSATIYELAPTRCQTTDDWRWVSLRNRAWLCWVVWDVTMIKDKDYFFGTFLFSASLKNHFQVEMGWFLKRYESKTFDKRNVIDGQNVKQRK